MPVTDDVVTTQALRRRAVGFTEDDTDLAEDFDLRPHPERLGVDEQPVHVEQDRRREGHADHPRSLSRTA